MQDSHILWKSETEMIPKGSLFHIKMWNILEENKNCSTWSETNESPLFRGWESLVSLFWTSGDVFPGFQSQGGFLICMLHCLHAIHCNQSWPTGSEKKENYLKRNCNQYQYSEWRSTKRLNFGWSVTPFYRTLKLVAKYKQSGHLHKEGLHSGSDNLRRY